MAGDIVISARNVSKAYRIWNHPAARLKSPLLDLAANAFPKNSGPHSSLRRTAAAGYTDFVALHDISFTVRRGEATGIIGRNGSGKSTLLQIVTGVMQPTSGSVQVNGRIAALLELGSGFNPEFTGRENVYLNATILGLSKAEIDRHFAEIAAFADIGDFMDQPVKIYSSGMMVRLAFSVATATQPDILIVDEALSVGDVFFQQKCFERIRQMLRNGTTLLFVSHDIAAVQNLCSRALLLKEGVAIFEGLPEDAASRYYAISSGKAAPTAAIGAPGTNEAAAESARANSDLKANILANNILPLARSRHGTGELTVVAASFLNEREEHSTTVEMTKRATVHAILEAHRDIASPSVGIHLIDRMNNVVFAAGTRQLRTPVGAMRNGERRLVTFQIEMAVQPGDYTFSLGCGEPSLDGPNHGYIQDRHEGLGPITVHADPHKTWAFYGMARLPMTITVHE